VTPKDLIGAEGVIEIKQLRAYPRRFFRFAAQYAFMRWDCALGAPANLPFLRFFIARLSFVAVCDE
jgi:hypothetical protein